MILNHLLVTMLASALAGLSMALVFIVLQSRILPGDYAAFAQLPVFEWLFGGKDGQPNPPDNPNVPVGFTLLVSVDGKIDHSQGDTPCRAGMWLRDCMPELVGVAVGQRTVPHDGGQWYEVVMRTALGQLAITRRAPVMPQPCFQLGDVVGFCSHTTFTLSLMFILTVLSLPGSLLLGWLSARPLLRRMRRIAEANRRFSSGELDIRVRDPNPDEIGTLAAQFDETAALIEQNVITLRELAERNAILAQAAEESATRAERTRLSRDLHDAIAQRLFSLSVSATTLPALIERDPKQGAEQARAVAALSEQTLLELRTVLVELRPNAVAQRGLNDALRTLCDDWSAAHHIQVAYNAILRGQHLPGPVADAAYYIVQEALSNVGKHAHADLVDVSILESQTQLTLSITDNGRGFDETAAGQHQAHYGLITMRERTQSLGGNLNIESDTRQGTTVRVTLPLQIGAPTP
jgi:signal transduction histidine kinase